MARHILIIDRLITANRRALVRRAKLSIREQFSARGWQRGWDACPDLKVIDTKLFAERDLTRDAMDRAAELAHRRAEAAERARYRAAAQAARISADCA
jgi:hypothetical protein